MLPVKISIGSTKGNVGLPQGRYSVIRKLVAEAGSHSNAEDIFFCRDLFFGKTRS